MGAWGVVHSTRLVIVNEVGRCHDVVYASGSVVSHACVVAFLWVPVWYDRV